LESWGVRQGRVAPPGGERVVQAAGQLGQCRFAGVGLAAGPVEAVQTLLSGFGWSTRPGMPPANRAGKQLL